VVKALDCGNLEVPGSGPTGIFSF